MDILNSGSFVPLDNRDKIEQLIFTAKTMATELSRAEGYQSSGPTNHQLGLEMWKGAEYMCRAHEEATIRNLFLGKFLETLRNIERNPAVQARPPQSISSPAANSSDPFQTKVVNGHANNAVAVPFPVAPSSELPSASQLQESRDEYLGVVSQSLPRELDRPSYASECMPEWEAEVAETNNETATDDFVTPLTESADYDEPKNFVAADSTRAAESVSAAGISDPASEIRETVEQAVEEVTERVEPDEAGETRAIESIVLSGKEPYNLEGCTITAVIQLLPESSGRRKCVVSLRTHDFAPLVAVSKAQAGDIIPHISTALSNALEQYRSDLPGKAAEKLKKEKPAAKKQSKTGSKSANTNTAQAKATENSDSKSVATRPAGTEQSQVGLFAS